MSFSQDLKSEILRKKLTKKCCIQAAAYGIACFGRYFDAHGLVLQTDNEAIAVYVQKLYDRCNITGQIIPKERPAGIVYEFSIKEPSQVQAMLAMFDHTGREPALRIHPDRMKCQNCVSAFLGAAFLCSGTATDPEKEYNIEFLTSRYQLSKDLEALLAEHEFNPHRTQRKGANIVYIKASDQIENLLAYMGAGGCAMRIMEQRMYNEMRNKTNRLSNCETANLGKSVQAAVQVQLAIRQLEQAGTLSLLPETLQYTARLRMQYPELALSALAEKFEPPVSKAGLSHRFKKIQEAAQRLSENKTL